MRFLKQFVVHCILWVCAFLAFVLQSDEAYNVFVFLLIALTAVSCIALTDACQLHLMKIGKRMPLWYLFNVSDFMMAIVVIWFGHWGLGLCIMFRYLMVTAGWSAALPKRAELDDLLVPRIEFFNMNWIKWGICWFNKKHVYTMFYDRAGRASRKCVRCDHHEGM